MFDENGGSEIPFKNEILMEKGDDDGNGKSLLFFRISILAYKE